MQKFDDVTLSSLRDDPCIAQAGSRLLASTESDDRTIMSEE
jgi:hypothetical protein